MHLLLFWQHANNMQKAFKADFFPLSLGKRPAIEALASCKVPFAPYAEKTTAAKRDGALLSCPALSVHGFS